MRFFRTKIGVSVGLLLMVALAIIFVSRKISDSRRASQSDILTCSLQTPQEWQKFLTEAAGNEKWVETCEDSTCDAKYFEQVRRHVQGVLEGCRAFISQNEKIKSCTENLRKFTPTWMRQHDDVSYGFNVDNSTYLREQEASDKPSGMMKVPDAIVAALPDQRRVQEAARVNGWKYLTHDSALGGLRTFIYIPDPQGRFDQWMLLNLKSAKQKNVTKGMPVSVLGVQKKTSDGKNLSQVRIHFRDYTLEEIGERVKLAVNETGNGKCYSCHSNGLRQLIPRRTPVLEARPVRGERWFEKNAPKDFPYWRLVEFNKIIRRYGLVDWDGKITSENLGPMLGAEQGCVNCHNGTSRGALTVFTSPAQLKQKMVAELSMPPNGTWLELLERSEMKTLALSIKEKAILDKAVQQHTNLAIQFLDSRFSQLQQWLLKNSCL